jgi:excisionase family DNA binding protein
MFNPCQHYTVRQVDSEICLTEDASMTTRSERSEGSDRGRLDDDGFVPVLVAAEFLSLSRASVYNLMDAGELPSAKFGKARRIRKSDLRAYAERCIASR